MRNKTDISNTAGVYRKNTLFGTLKSHSAHHISTTKKIIHAMQHNW